MPFPWRRYWRRVGAVFIIALAVSLLVLLMFSAGRLSALSVAVAVVDSVVLAVVAAFPLTQTIYRGPRR